jgi:hypothetical protein
MPWRKRKSLVAYVQALLALLCLSLVSTAQTSDDETERIRSFDSHIILNADGTMQVRETIEVQAAGDQIRHGIYRDFPTRYKDHLGNRYSVAFEIVGVQRDGNPEPYHTQGISGGVRIYFGDSNTMISPGIHRYVFTYNTNRQLGFFTGHDQLYWNAVGLGWDFPIDAATATVVLPPQIHNFVSELDAFTGALGEKGNSAVISRDENGNPQFRAQNLPPHQGLTIVVNWPKGLIAAPTRQQRFEWYLSDNRNTAIGLAGLIAVLLYYFVVWARVGRHPKAGPVVPLYEPPDNMSPAAMRYLEKMHFDDQAFTSAILGLAAKGHLTIDGGKSDHYRLNLKTDTRAGRLSADEAELKRNLFGKGKTLTLSGSSSVVIRQAQKALSTALHTAMEKTYFVTNAGYLWPGLALTVLSAVGMLIATGAQGGASELPLAIFMTIWLSGWSVGVGALLHAVARAWKGARAGGVAGGAGAMGITLFSIPFVIGELVGLGVLAWAISVASCVVIILLLSSNALFHHLLKAPTRAGRQLLDRIEGFKIFLAAVDAPRLNAMGAPGRTPELFERFLPYALALGVENAWAEQFSQVLATAAVGAPSHQGASYSPSWYSGSFVASSPGAFASSFSSTFGSALSSSSSPPGSSSGSSGGGGGGFSGGGGGGGGGGGW